jgi:hypothetical protein
MGDSVHKHPSYFQIIENFWGNKTDYITIPIEEGRSAYSQSFQNKIRVIPQGFDMSNVKIDETFKGNSIPQFAYSGVIHPSYRDPSNLLRYLATLKEMNFRFVVYTKQRSFYSEFKLQLGDKLILKDYVPREQLIFELSQMDFLINLKNESTFQAPSKLIDFYITGRPIIDISTGFNEKEVLNEFLIGDYRHQHVKQDLSQYKIQNVTNNFIKIYNESTCSR